MSIQRREEKSTPARGGGRWRERAHELVGQKEREPFGSSFYMFFFLPPGPALCKLGLVRSAVLPEVLTPVLGPSFDLLLFYFLGLFPSLSFSHRQFGLLFSTLPNTFFCLGVPSCPNQKLEHFHEFLLLPPHLQPSLLDSLS